MRQAPQALAFAGYTFDKQLLSDLFGAAPSAKGRTVKKLWDGTTHAFDESAVKEIVSRKDELFGYRDTFSKQSKTLMPLPHNYIDIKRPSTCRRRSFHIQKSKSQEERYEENKHPFVTKGALLYRGKPCMCALRGRQPGRWKTGLFCVTAFRTRGCTPCAAYAAIPACFGWETICLHGCPDSFPSKA